MGFLSDHPHTAITDTIDLCVSRPECSLEVELGTLVGLIRNKSSDYEYETNQEEAARALRKKLKYGNRLQQSRSLDLFDLFVTQGLRFVVLYNDDKLIERLQGIALNKVTDSRGGRYSSKIVKKCANYVLGWYSYAVSNGAQSNRAYASIVELGRVVKRHYSRTRQSRERSNFMNDQADESVHATNDPDQMYGIPRIDIKKAAPAIRVVISDGLAAAISLRNSLMVLPSGARSTDDEEATARFIQARSIRRKVLRYLQLVTEEEFLGSLIHANDELVKALASYDEKSGASEASNEELYSDEDEDQDSSGYESSSVASVQPSTSSNPFGDQNKI